MKNAMVEEAFSLHFRLVQITLIATGYLLRSIAITASALGVGVKTTR